MITCDLKTRLLFCRRKVQWEEQECVDDWQVTILSIDNIPLYRVGNHQRQTGDQESTWIVRGRGRGKKLRGGQWNIDGYIKSRIHVGSCAKACGMDVTAVPNERDISYGSYQARSSPVRVSALVKGSVETTNRRATEDG